jgi:hypothetical protein
LDGQLLLGFRSCELSGSNIGRGGYKHFTPYGVNSRAKRAFLADFAAHQQVSPMARHPS